MEDTPLETFLHPWRSVAVHRATLYLARLEYIFNQKITCFFFLYLAYSRFYHLDLRKIFQTWSHRPGLSNNNIRGGTLDRLTAANMEGYLTWIEELEQRPLEMRTQRSLALDRTLIRCGVKSRPALNYGKVIRRRRPHKLNPGPIEQTNYNNPPPGP